MIRVRFVSFLMFALSVFAFAPALIAQADWQKTYPVSGKPSLTLTTGDVSTEVRSCGTCREVRIRVQWNDRHPDDYTITEFQSADHVNFEIKEKQHFGIHIGMHRGPQVVAETPSQLDLEARTGDGSLKVYGVQGNISLHTGDGAVDVSDVSGAVRLVASDGAIRIHNLNGTLESKSSDGSVTIDGRLSGLQVHTSDGSLDVTLADGSSLATASRIEASDGQVRIRLPRTLAADLEIHTSDGKIDCQLPLTMNGYNSGGGHSIRGRLNAGGTPLTIHTSDGNVTIAAL